MELLVGRRAVETAQLSKQLGDVPGGRKAGREEGTVAVGGAVGRGVDTARLGVHPVCPVETPKMVEAVLSEESARHVAVHLALNLQNQPRNREVEASVLGEFGSLEKAARAPFGTGSRRFPITTGDTSTLNRSR